MRLLGEWLESNSRKSGSRLVLAADVGGPFESRVGRATALVRALAGRVVAVKVNWHLLLPYGVLGLAELAAACREEGLPLIADMKLNDIGSTDVEAARTLFSNGFDAVIANPFVGYEGAMADLIAESRRREKGVILLVYMSHAGAGEGYGLTVGGAPLYAAFARRTREWGADGAVVSARSPSVIREVRALLGEGQVILSPGVGAQGGDAREALLAGADYLIVGRSIVEADDPVRAADALIREAPR
ncbi:MAG: orotidine 5'-phosphate decarboxylase [Nitrososphaerota archaeon]|nr:orotidine 5'-phosphate decarboxylase [Nitrososphaerota archaeon]MDG7020690.1 orotidine 5'-phosphate decarboxylase [Nitrososphaerota archaeon]MDG7022080.1 orotidine 5'-phosphate decarboxylase [Nitrososphaerota archaeon]